MALSAYRRTVAGFVATGLLALFNSPLWGLDDVTASVKVEIRTPGTGEGFSRGDSNQDGNLDISDAVSMLTYLFAEGSTSCELALDANDDENVDVSDPIYLLSYLFSGQSPPPFPFGAGVCGEDPTPGSLTCSSFNNKICGGVSNSRLVKLVNTGENIISTPIIAVIEAIEGPKVAVANADGSRGGKPYFEYSRYIPGGAFHPRDKTEEREWEFLNPEGIDFSVSVRVEGYMGRTGWLPGSGLGREGTEPPKRDIQKLEPASINYKVNVPGFTVKQRTVKTGAKSERFQSLHTPLGSTMRSIGKPALPTHTQLLAVPQGATVVTSAATGKPLQYNNYRILPCQPQPVDREDIPPPPFSIDEKFYSQDFFYPRKLVSVTEGTMRGMRIIAVRTSLCRYNGASGELLVYPDIDVGIEFEKVPVKGPSSFTDEENRAPGFEHILQATVLNQSHAVLGVEQVAVGRVMLERFRDLLIITHPDFEAAASELADWKIDHGLRTILATTEATGTTTEEIADYIEMTYSIRGIEYVLLFGDSEHIPTFYQSRHPVVPPYGHSPLYMGSDLYYVTIDGPTPAGTRDYFPDMTLGRIPVDTSAEAQTIVDTIKDYEQFCGPGAPGAWAFYNNATLAAYFEDQDPQDGTADCGYAETIEKIAIFLNGEGYTPNRLYWTWNGVDPAKWNDGTDIPNYLKRENGFDWDGTGNDIINSINNSTFMLAHRDHGSRSGWTHPSFTNGDTGDLTNSSLRPAVFSINCQTGWFDNETDEADYGTGNGEECFAENLLREPEGGAIGVFAPTRNTPSLANNQLLLGMLDGIWPSLLPGFPGAEDTVAGAVSGSRRLGHILNHGKLRVFAEYGDETACDAANSWCDNLDDISMSRSQFEMYHCLGDPTLRLRTSLPACFVAVLPPLEVQQQAYRLSLNPKYEGAKVSFRQGSDLLGQGFVHDGEATVNLRETLNPQQDVFVLIDKKGYAPLKEKVEFASRGNLYSLQVPVQSEGAVSVGVHSIKQNGDLLFQEMQPASGTGYQMCCKSGFTGSSEYLFACANQSNLINVFSFEEGGLLSPVKGSPFATKGKQPVSLAVNTPGSTLYAVTGQTIVEVFQVEEGRLKEAMDPVKVSGSAWDVEVLRIKTLRPPYFREFVYVSNYTAPPEKGSGLTVFRKKEAGLTQVQFLDLAKFTSRPGKKMRLAPGKQMLYLLDLDNGILPFSIDADTGELAFTGNEPVSLGGFCNEICLTHSEEFLFASLPYLENGPQILVLGVQNDGSLKLLHSAESCPTILSLETSSDDQYLYGASRTGDGICRWAILQNGALEYLGLFPDGHKATAPQALWIRD